MNNSLGIGGPTVNGYYSSADSVGTKKRKAVMERNLIVGSQTGIAVGLQNLTQIIQNNTITDCSVAITLTSCPSATINFNNIQNCTQKSITLANTLVDIDATYNWWGTTDVAAINQSIYDFKNDFYLGKVNFVPLLTEPNPEASANLVIPEFSSWMLLPMFLVTTFVVVAVRKKILGGNRAK